MGERPGKSRDASSFSVFEMNNGVAKNPNNGFKGAVSPLIYLTNDYITGYDQILTNLSIILRDMLNQLLKFKGR